MEDVKDKLMVIVSKMEEIVKEITNVNYNDKESELANAFVDMTRYFTLYREHIKYKGLWEEIKSA
jgi:hypothetical protein